MKKIFAVIVSQILLLFCFNSCSPSEKFTNKNDETNLKIELPSFKNEIRVLLAEKSNSLT